MGDRIIEGPLQDPKPSYNTLALVAFALAWVPFMIPATLAFGHVARREAARKMEAGAGLAAAALTLAYVQLFFICLWTLMIVAAINTAGS